MKRARPRNNFFFTIWVFFMNIHHSQDSKRMGRPLLFTTFTRFADTSQLGDYCRELTSTRRQQPYSHREPLVSERKSLTTKLRSLKRRKEEYRKKCTVQRDYCVKLLRTVKRRYCKTVQPMALDDQVKQQAMKK